MALQRRLLLQSIIGVSVGLVGCTNSQGEEGGATPTETPVSTPEARKIQILLHNHRSESVIVSLELSIDGDVSLEDETTIDPNGYAVVDTGINEKGEYLLTLGVDDSEEAYSFDIDEYALEMGSNTVVWIRENEIEFGQEQ